MAYPTSTELNSFLTAAGITLGATERTQAIDSAIATWKEWTGCAKFLSDGSSESEIIDGNGGTVLSVPWFVSISAVYRDVYRNATSGTPSTSSVSVTGTDGTALTMTVTNANNTTATTGRLLLRDVDYWLKAGTDGKPIYAIEFSSALCETPRSVVITGVRGYCSTLAQNHFNAILQLAAAWGYVIDSNKQTTGLTKVSIGGDLDAEWGGWADTPVQMWRDEARGAAMAIRRRTV